MPPHQLDTKNFPLVYLQVSGDVGPAQVAKHFEGFRQLLERNEQYALVFDASEIGKFDAIVRKEYAEFVAANEAEFRRLCVGCGYVLTSAIVRGALTAVLWLTGSLPYPHKICAKSEEAEEWALGQLKKFQAP